MPPDAPSDSALLAAGLCGSFARALGPGGAAARGWPRRIAGMAWAATFFALLHIWNYGDAGISFGQRGDLLRALFLLS